MNWIRNASYLILALSLSSCSWFAKEPEVTFNHDLRKQDRVNVEPPQCMMQCPDPDPLGLKDVYPHREEGDKGIVRFTSDDYDSIADNLQGDQKYLQQLRLQKKCRLRCEAAYKRYLERFNED